MDILEVPYSMLDTNAELTRPRLIAFLFADWATQSKDDKVALGGVFDKLFLPASTPGVGTFYIYLRLAETYQDFVRIVLYTPDGQPQGELTIDGRELAPTRGEPNYLQVVSRVSMDLPVPGTWWFDVQYQGQCLGRVPLLVMSSEDEANGNADETPV